MIVQYFTLLLDSAKSMTQSLRALIEKDQKLSKYGRLLFSYKTTTTYEDKYRQYLVCFLDKAMVIMFDSQAKTILNYTKLSVKKDYGKIKFRWRKKDKKVKFDIPMKDEKLLNDFYTNIYEKIRIEKVKVEEKDNEPKKEDIFSKKNDSSSSFRDPSLLYLKVCFANLNFFTNCRLNGGISGVKKSVLKRISDYVIPNHELKKNRIDLEVFKSLKFFLRHKRSIFLLENDEDLLSSAAFLDNKLEIIIER